MTRLSDLLDRVSLFDVIAQEWGPEAVSGLHRERGGCIRDLTPGHEERNASFSVYPRNGRLRWKRHSDVNGAGGSAFDFLLRQGHTPAQARDTLARMAGVGFNPWQPVQERPPLPCDPLQDARAVLSRCAPFDSGELKRARRYMTALCLQDVAGRDLKARGLYEWRGLSAGRLARDYWRGDGALLALAGALAFFVRGPDGQPWALKVRNLGTSDSLQAADLSRYVYRIGGHGAPAWCSPKYGAGDAVLIVEGELNGAAASRALRIAGARLDVQGLAGANGVPFLDGLKDRPVYVYADPDAPGAACVERVARIARAAGAREVRPLTPLPEGDFCDLAGQMDIHAFGAVLLDRLSGADHWQPATTGNSPLPANKAAQNGENLHWQTGSAHQDWGGVDTSGWGTADRGGW